MSTFSVMRSGKVTIPNRLGMHARPAATLVGEATKFSSEVWLERDGLKINAKSIMGVMMLAAEQGAELTIYVEGDDEEQAFEAVEAVIVSGFGEMENGPGE